MVVTPSGIVTEVKPEQRENAESPMVVTPSGIVTEVKLEQPLNAAAAIVVTGYPSITSGISSAPKGEVQPVIVTSPFTTSYIGVATGTGIDTISILGISVVAWIKRTL